MEGDLAFLRSLENHDRQYRQSSTWILFVHTARRRTVWSSLMVTSICGAVQTNLAFPKNCCCDSKGPKPPDGRGQDDPWGSSTLQKAIVLMHRELIRHPVIHLAASLSTMFSRYLASKYILVSRLSSSHPRSSSASSISSCRRRCKAAACTARSAVRSRWVETKSAPRSYECNAITAFVELLALISRTMRGYEQFMCSSLSTLSMCICMRSSFVIRSVSDDGGPSK